MTLTVLQIVGGVRRVRAGVAGLEQELNAADGQLGDGDTGSMLARVIEKMAGSNVAEATSVSEAFSSLAKAAAAATGSSLGTLFITALMSLARQTKDRDGVEWSELGDLIAGARDAMQARGGAVLGDKTVLDALDMIAAAVGGHDTPHAVAEAAVAAGRHALDSFRDRPCRIGRARFFAERSVGLDDPGMLAVVRLTELLAAEPDT